MPGTGLEPALPFENLILSQMRIPFRHPGIGVRIPTSFPLLKASVNHVRFVLSLAMWPKKWTKSGKDRRFCRIRNPDTNSVS